MLEVGTRIEVTTRRPWRTDDSPRKEMWQVTVFRATVTRNDGGGIYGLYGYVVDEVVSETGLPTRGAELTKVGDTGGGYLRFVNHGSDKQIVELTGLGEHRG